MKSAYVLVAVGTIVLGSTSIAIAQETHVFACFHADLRRPR